MTHCGQSGLTRYLECPNLDVAPESLPAGIAVPHSWQRWATAEEIVSLHVSGDLPEHEEEARMLVVACGDHVIEEDLRPHTHDSTCRAPGSGGSCGICQ